MPFSTLNLSRHLPSLRQTLGAALVTAAVLGFTATTASAASQLNVGVNPWIGFAPLYVADAKGFFTAHGLDVKLVNFDAPATVPGAIYSGQIGAGAITYDQVIGANAKGWNLKVVMPIDYSAGADALLSSSDITSVSQLKGKKVAYAPLTPSDFLLGYALKQAGLSKKDITTVNVPAEGVPGAMVGGSTKAGVTFEPSISSIVQAGGGKKFHVLFSSKDAPGLITDVLVFNPKTMKEQPETVTAFIQAFLDGVDYIKSNPEDAQAVIGKALGESAADAKDQLSGVGNFTLPEMKAAMTKSDSLPSFWVSGPIIGTLLKSEGEIQTIPSIGETYDASFVETLAAKK